MNTVILVLRTIHVFAGVLWVGSAIFYLLFVEPATKALGPAGGRFTQELVGRLRYPLFMNTVSILTILAGAALLWLASGGLQWAWLASGPGIGFSLGSVVGLAVWVLGFVMLKPRAERMGALGAEMGRAGGPPTPEQAAEMHKLGEEMTAIGRVDAILLSISLVLMATARYWTF